MMGYLYIVGCIAFTVYGQLVIKWRMTTKGDLPQAAAEKVTFLLQTLFGDLYIISGFAAAFAAGLLWMAAMTKFDLSFAYPFTALAFVLVMVLSTLLLGESFTVGKSVGVSLICAGIIVVARS